MPTDYVEYNFLVSPKDPWEDMLLAELESLPFESFDQSDGSLKAYVPQPYDTVIDLDQISLFSKEEVKITWKKKQIVTENWNARWESEFQPISIGKDCIVRADFHPPQNKKYELVITPKMSFGTGHHQTTQMMLSFALTETVEGKRILDMGCGTGVLGILTSLRGALSVDALDNDPWCVENTRENALRNGCKNISTGLADSLINCYKQYDLIFANINRNVLLDQLPSYHLALNKGGILLLSGFYEEDIFALKQKSEALGLKLKEQKKEGEWCALKFDK